MRALAVLVSVSLLGCFPHNARHRTYAKVAEGGAIIGGVAMLAVVNTGADCDTMARPGVPQSDCRAEAGVLGSIGLALILAGMVGFIATVSTAPADPAAPPSTAPPAPPAPAPAQ